MSPHAFSALAPSSSDLGAEWMPIDTERLPRQTFDLVVAFARTRFVDEALQALVSIRNALTRDGKLLVVVGAKGAWGNLHDLVTRAGFTRMRELPAADGSQALELQR
jgi:hypothetical protein